MPNHKVTTGARTPSTDVAASARPRRELGSAARPDVVRDGGAGHSTAGRGRRRGDVGDGGNTAALRLSQLAQVQDSGRSTLPPDPLVIACVLEGLDAEREATIAALLEEAVARLGGAHAVRISAASADPTLDIADELAAHEEGHQVVVYIIGAGAGERGAAVTAHADRVLLVQPLLGAPLPPPPATSPATARRGGTPKSHT